jgi:beta-phosphoglucomutase
LEIRACIFDLDGVLVDTAEYHFHAWKYIASELGIPFSSEDNEQLKGISRVDSFNKLLEIGQVHIPTSAHGDWLVKKNEIYLEYLNRMGPGDILPGVHEFLEQLKNENIKIALGSASKNAPKVLDLLQITKYFDVIVDGNDVQHSKPDPEVFLQGASKLKLTPDTCIVFEDSIKGIEAALKGGFNIIGVGNKSVLTEAQHVISGFEQFTIHELYRLYQ